jgi:hypothetical protein
MAESITEGTLKSWSKQVGDTVAADEEVATIETDKVRILDYPDVVHGIDIRLKDLSVPGGGSKIYSLL